MYGIDREKYKARKARQQKVLLVQAKEAARSWKFAEAEELLEQAGNMNHSSREIEAVQQLITDERAEQAEQRRRENETEQNRITRSKQQQQATPSTTSSSSSCSQLVSFSFDGPGAEHSASVQLGVPVYRSILNGRGTSNVSVVADGNDCIGGEYTFTYSNNASWTGGSEQRSYSGSFVVPPSASYCSVTISQGFSATIGVSCD